MVLSILKDYIAEKNDAICMDASNADIGNLHKMENRGAILSHKYFDSNAASIFLAQKH